MPGTNLTRAEARERADLVRVDTYRVDLDFTAGGETFDSVTEIRFSCSRPGASTFLDLVAPGVREITCNGRSLDPATAYVDGRVLLTDLAAENVVRVAADCAYMNTGEGLHRTVDPADGRTYLYTHFEVPEARRLYATFEQPDLKASFEFTITAPAGWVVRSNSATPEPVPAADPASGAAAATWRFAPTPRISTYITAVIAGEYHLVHDAWTGPDGRVVPLAIACRRSMAEFLDPEEIFEVTKLGFDYYVDKFDQPYPFTKYDQVFVPEYNIGAMENVGCVTFSETYVFRSKATDAARKARAETILHELAHMWFGDLVTMRWWDDLWLKESFATYVSVRCMGDTGYYPAAWTRFAAEDKLWGLHQDQLPSTHPIVADIRDLEDVALNFDGITYAKGAAVLKQLVAWVGPEEFFTGCRHYFDAYAWGNTTLADLLAALEKTSGRDLTDWSRAWLQTAGPNTLRPEFTVGDDGRFTSFAVLQEAPAEHPTLRPHRIVVGLYDRTDEGLVRVDRIEADVTGARTDLPELVGRRRPDVVLLNDDDLTFASLRLDDASMAVVRDHIGEFVDPLPRALCWAAAWDMVRAAELGASDYVAMVLGGIGRETEIAVVEELHMTVREALDFYVDPAHQERVAAAVAAAAREGLFGAEPGGDVQLYWARLLTRVATAGDDLDLIAGLRGGTATVDGLTVDTELRWALVAALTRSGRLSDAEIDAELARDNTTAGAQYAAGARAALPTAEAKEAAWASVVDRDDLPNRMQDHIMFGGRTVGVGMVQATQLDLLRPFVVRYFEVLRGVWASRTFEIARNLATGLYPRLFVEPETLERTDAFLAAGDVPPALTRLLAEERSNIARALAARARDRA